MDEDHYTAAEYNDDPRPNLWKKPGGNWARIEFNNLNIHHTNEKNWARGADFHVDGAVFSDNSRGWIHRELRQHLDQLNPSRIRSLLVSPETPVIKTVGMMLKVETMTR